jgi:protein-disulfide isomerase
MLKFMLVGFLILFGSSSHSAVSAQAVRGNPFAEITITEYVDFQCSSCAEAKKTIDETISKYHGNVNLVIKHLPLDYHAGAMPAARYFEALYKSTPARAWEFYNLAFDDQKTLKDGEAGVRVIIDKLKLNQKEMQQLAERLADPLIDVRIHKDIIEADAMEVDEVPFILVNGHKIDTYNSVDEINRVINALIIEKNKTYSNK